MGSCQVMHVLLPSKTQIIDLEKKRNCKMQFKLFVCVFYIDFHIDFEIDFGHIDFEIDF
jgi:hypothetical protein